MKEPKAETTTVKPFEPPAESSTAITDAPESAGATATSPTSSSNLKDRRRSSFFGTITGRKDRKSVEPKDRKPEVTSESEVTDGETKKNKGLQGLLRKASKSVKPRSSPAANSSVPPVPPKDGEGVKTAEEAAPGTTTDAAVASSVADSPTVVTSSEAPEPTTETTAAAASSEATAAEPAALSSDAPVSSTNAQVAAPA